MSEEIKRTIEEVSGDYAKAATQLGDFEYKIACFKGESDVLKKKMFDLNTEGAAIKAASNVVNADTVQ